MDKNWMTEEAAAHKYCPKIGDYCLVSDCMFWEWQDPMYRWGAESPGEGWVKGEMDEWMVAATDGKPPKFEWYKVHEEEKGKCGIRC